MYNTHMSKFIGIFGGAFDPPHIAHIHMAQALIKERSYDKLVLLPSHNPPHKTLSASDTDRLNMLKLIAGDKIEVSDIELKRNGIGYTFDYLPEVIEKYGENIEYIIGGDSFLNFDKWYKPLEILKLTKLLVVPRDGKKDILYNKLEEYKSVNKKGIAIAEYLPESISSSQVRNALRLQLDVSDKLDIKVLQYIKTANLYNEYGKLIDKLKSNISEERFAHTIGVVEYALKYCDKLKLDYDKVFKACLLHDCAKNCSNLQDIVIKYNLPHDCIGTPIAHAFCGSVVANIDYGIEDKDILEAICYHATARPKMETLDKLVYCADMIEKGRNFEGVDKLREIFDKDFNEGFKACLESTIKFLENENKEIYPLTLDAYHYYFNK